MSSLLEVQKNKQLTVSEQGDLFSNYLGITMHLVVLEHFHEVVEDEDVKQYILLAKGLMEKHSIKIKDIYSQENIPIPIGFGEEDLNRNAGRLMSDVFMVIYITYNAKAAIGMYSNALAEATRKDLIEYFKLALNESVEIYESGLNLLYKKGHSNEPPVIPYPKERSFVKKKSFISLLTANPRPLTATEVKYLIVNINTNILGKAIMLAYSQVTTSKELELYFRKGEEVAGNQIVELGQFLLDNDIPVPSLLEAEITDSTSPPFSDKILLFHTSMSNAVGFQNYGVALSKIMRHDVSAKFAMLTAEISKYANEGLELMIKHGWLEEPPTCPDRKNLSNAAAINADSQ